MGRIELINHTYKCAFVHIPKTAGMSIVDFFKDEGLWENPDSHHEKISKEISKEYFVFVFVRNPWDRFVSEYHWVQSMRSDTRWKNALAYGPPHYRTMSFVEICNQTEAEFLEGYPVEFGQRQHIIPQLDVITDLMDFEDVDFIGRFENLQEDFNIVCDKIGIPRQELPHKNKSKHKHYTEYYDDETKQIVAEKYAKDIEYFGYEFGE
jgi:hypothetical protein